MSSWRHLKGVKQRGYIGKYSGVGLVRETSMRWEDILVLKRATRVCPAMMVSDRVDDIFSLITASFGVQDTNHCIVVVGL